MRTKWIEWGLCAGLLLSGGAVLADGSPPGGGMAQHEAAIGNFSTPRSASISSSYSSGNWPRSEPPPPR